MLLFLLACRPTVLEEGDTLLTVDGDRLVLTVGDRVLFETTGPIEARTIDETVETSLGIWKFDRLDTASTPLVDLRVKRDRIELGESGSITIENAEGRTTLTIDAGTQADAIAVPLACDDQGSFHGFGAQYHQTDQRGERFNLFVSEQGIGRTNELFFFNGDRHTTYFPMPWILDGRGHGVLFETDYRVNVDLCATDTETAWVEVTSGEPLVVTLFHGPTVPDVIRQLGDRIGRPTAPPSWAFDGVWLMTQGGSQAVRDQLAAAQAANVPVSAVWIQDWTGARQNLGGGYGVQYRWEADTTHLYPDLAALVSELHGQDVKAMGYVNPFVDPVLEHWEPMEAGGMLPTNDEGSVCTFLGPRGQMTTADLSNPATQEYIRGYLRAAVVDIGLDGWMADFGEWLPLDCTIHEGDARAFHNRYPEAWQRLTREVMEEVRPDGDWVMYGRSGWTGVHSVAQLHWIGDQEADWGETDGLPTVVPAMLNLGLSGQPFVTHDVAGFSGGPSTPELYRRWIELGAFTPVFRLHDGNNRADNHRWDTDSDTTAFFSRFARIHAALGPEMAALAEEAETTGMPMIRHLMLHYPQDRETWDLNDQFLLGEDLLVAPVTEQGVEEREVYLPQGTWYDVWTGASQQGPGWVTHPAPIGKIPVFSRTDRDDLRGI